MIHDVVFIQFGELNADENFQRLLDLIPHGGISRVKNVEGIPQAHLSAARKAGTDWFFVVDGDNYVLDDFDFEYEPNHSEDTTIVWHARNPYNGLEYGYGGIKMFHRKTLIKKLKDFEMGTDMSTGLFDNFHVIEKVGSETRFATSTFDAWKGAFRECVKLASKTISGQRDEETEQRLKAWQVNTSGEFADYVCYGASEGWEYGERYADNPEKLKKINDFVWLQKKFRGYVQ